MLEIAQIPVLSDNYVYLLHDPASGETAAVDPAVAGPVLDTLNHKGWSLSYILNTHHHWDHVGANLELKNQTGCSIIGSEYDRNRIPGLDRCVSDGDKFHLGNCLANVISTPGHTLGHVVFHFPQDHVLFCGDTLFVMGCGRLFEGTAEQMFDSLQKLKDLPEATKVYCAHEYTLQNANFALTLEPENTALIEKVQNIKRLRSDNRPTVPSTIGQELATNPFFRSDNPDLKTTLGMQNASPVEIFAETRKRKDNF